MVRLCIVLTDDLTWLRASYMIVVNLRVFFVFIHTGRLLFGYLFYFFEVREALSLARLGALTHEFPIRL